MCYLEDQAFWIKVIMHWLMVSGTEKAWRGFVRLSELYVQQNNRTTDQAI